MAHRKQQPGSCDVQMEGSACVMSDSYDTALITELHAGLSLRQLSCMLSQSGLFFLYRKDKHYSVKWVILLHSTLTMTWTTCFPFDSASFPVIEERQRLCRQASCAADSVDSVSTDKPNWVLMSTSWGSVPDLIIMAFIGHFLPLMRPSCHVNWMIPRYNQILDWWTNKPKARSESNSYRSHASLMSSLLFQLFDVTPSGEHIAALDQRHYGPID